jgi:hypothetical protein
MFKNFTAREIALIAALLVILSTLRNSCAREGATQLRLKEYIAGEMAFASKIDALQRQVHTQDMAIADYNKDIKRILAENTHLKEKLAYQSKMRIKAELKAKLVPIIVDTVRDTVYVAVGSRFAVQERFFAMNAHLKTEGLMIDSLSLPLNITLNIGKKGKAEVLIDNPYVRMEGFNTLQVKHQKPFYESWWFGFILGSTSGSLLLYGAQKL